MLQVAERDPFPFLLSANPWTEYRTRVELLGEREESAAVLRARSGMLAHPLVRGLIEGIASWPGPALTRHDKADLPIHVLVQLAEMGVRRGDPLVDAIAGQALAHPSPEGPPQVVVNIAKGFGGSGQDDWAWLMCDAPVTLYGLALMGFRDDSRVLRGVEALTALTRENGWPCAGGASIGRFRGPGSRRDPCPLSNFLMLRLLSLYDGFETDKQRGIDCLLELWQDSRERAPYLFRMGTDFRKLKAPAQWYGLVGVADALSRYPSARGDPRLAEMVDLIARKARPDGTYVPDSTYRAWGAWDFGQKKAPSGWLTFLAARILSRFSERASEAGS